MNVIASDPVDTLYIELVGRMDRLDGDLRIAETRAKAAAGIIEGSFTKAGKDSGEEITKGMGRAGEAQERLATQATRNAARVEGAWKVAGASISMIATGAAAAAAALGVVATASVNAFAGFEQQMKGVQAVLGSTEEEYKALSKAALDSGAQTRYSATEAAGAIEELAKAGLSAAEIMGGGLKGSTDLAAAAGIGLAEAATIGTTAMKAFGLTAADLPRLADTIAAAANSSALDVSDLGLALQALGPIGKDAGLSFEQVSAALAKMADQGIRGSDAGTSLKTMLMSLTPNSDKAADAMRRLGLEAFDANGAYRPFAEIVADVRPKLASLTNEARALALETIFGSDATRAASIIFGDTGRTIEDYTEQVSKSGEAARNAATRQDTLQGAQERLAGTVETLSIQLGERLAPAFVESIDKLDSFLSSLQDTGRLTDFGNAVSWLAGQVGGLFATLEKADKQKTLQNQATALYEAGKITEAGFRGLIAAIGEGRLLAAQLSMVEYRPGPGPSTLTGPVQGPRLPTSGGPVQGPALPPPVRSSGGGRTAAEETRLAGIALKDYTDKLDTLTIAQLRSAAAIAKAAGEDQKYLLIRTELDRKIRESGQAVDKATREREAAEDKAAREREQAAARDKSARESHAKAVDAQTDALRKLKVDLMQATADGKVSADEASNLRQRYDEWKDTTRDAGVALSELPGPLQTVTSGLLDQAGAMGAADAAAEKYAKNLSVIAENAGNVQKALDAVGVLFSPVAENNPDADAATVQAGISVDAATRAAVQGGKAASFKNNLLADLEKAFNLGDPAKLAGQVTRLREFINGEFFKVLPASQQKRLTDALETFDAAATSLGLTVYGRVVPTLKDLERETVDSIMAALPGAPDIDLANRANLDPRLVPEWVKELDLAARNAAVALGLTEEAATNAAIAEAERLTAALRVDADGDDRAQDPGRRMSRDLAVQSGLEQDEINNLLRGNDFFVSANTGDRLSRDPRYRDLQDEAARAHQATIEALEVLADEREAARVYFEGERDRLIALEAAAGQLGDPRGTTDAGRVARGMEVGDAIGLEPDTLAASAEKLELINRLLADPAYDEHREFLLQARADSEAWQTELGGIVDSATLLGYTVGEIDLSPIDPTQYLAGARDAFEVGIIGASEYAAELENAIAQLEQFGDGSLETQTKIASLKKELEDLRSPLDEVAKGVSIVSDLLRRTGNEDAAIFADGLDTAISVASKLAKDPLGALGKALSFIADLFTKAAREAEEFRVAMNAAYSTAQDNRMSAAAVQAENDYQRGLISYEEYQQALTNANKYAIEQRARDRRIEILADTKITEDARQRALDASDSLYYAELQQNDLASLGNNIADAVRGGFESGIRGGIEDAIRSGDPSKLTDLLERSVGDAVLDGMIDAFIQSQIMEGVIGPAVQAWVAAAGTSGTDDDAAALAGLENAAARAADLTGKFLTDVQPIVDRFGLEDPTDPTKGPVFPDADKLAAAGPDTWRPAAAVTYAVMQEPGWSIRVGETLTAAGDHILLGAREFREAIATLATGGFDARTLRRP